MLYRGGSPGAEIKALRARSVLILHRPSNAFSVGMILSCNHKRYQVSPGWIERAPIAGVVARMTA